MTYYDCYHNTPALGLTIDGVADGHVTNDTFCHWEAVTGNNNEGTYVRTTYLDHTLEDHPEYDADVFFEQFYFDSDTPTSTSGGSHNTPIYDLG